MIEKITILCYIGYRFYVFDYKIKTTEIVKENSMDFTSLLKPMQKSSIRISYDENFNGKCPIGISKIGGMPDLPLDFQWYYYRGKSYEETIASLPPELHKCINREDAQYNVAFPLSFLAQINCEEASKYDKDSLLPSKGMLYFFYELATMTWGFDPKDKGSAKVYYFPGEISELNRTDFPSDLLDEYKLPEMPITFSTTNELPCFEEFMQWHDGFEYKQWNEYDEAKNKIVQESEEENINKLLGYADLIQGGMLLNCEETTNGVYTGGISEIPEEKLRQYKENCTKWQLLFQLDSISISDYEMLWGDVGRIYYYVNVDDLLKSNFDNCWLILQCC